MTNKKIYFNEIDKILLDTRRDKLTKEELKILGYDDIMRGGWGPEEKKEPR